MDEKGTDILKKKDCPTSVHSYDAGCKTLLSQFKIGGQVVHETLPANMVDLDRETVCSWGVVEEIPEMLDQKIVSSGTLNLYRSVPKDPYTVELIPSPISWALTEPDVHGHSNVILDQSKVTSEALLLLFIAGVICC